MPEPSTGPLRRLRRHLPLKGEDIVVLGPEVARLESDASTGRVLGPLKVENIVVLTVLPLQGEVPAEQAEGARGRAS